jgi:hypothetical protein
MQQVFVLSSTKKPLMPTHPARARKLLKRSRAAVYRHYPFTIILKDREEGETQPITLKVDPGSRGTGVALLKQRGDAQLLLWAANLMHRGLQIKAALDKRRMHRRSRRSRKTRYRKPRFNNRARPAGWLAPSIKSRWRNVLAWAKKLMSYCPITAIEVESVRFDTQLLENPDISGVAYQRGTLHGYEVKEYLLERDGRKCAYCKAENTPLEIEHVIPKSRGGSNRIDNLTLACRPCNQKKNNLTATEFGFPGVQERVKRPLKDAAAVNSMRWQIVAALSSLGLATRFYSGGRTKFNRVNNGLPKDHWTDAACVGTSDTVIVPHAFRPLEIKAVGRGRRQMCLMDRYGFPRTKPKAGKQFFGFKTGDMVKVVVPGGKNRGTHEIVAQTQKDKKR